MNMPDLPSAQAQVSAIGQGLAALRDRLIAGGARGLYKAGNIIMTDSKDNYCPVRDGILRGSGFVKEPVIEENDAYVVLGYGGAAEAYALVQHEDLSFHHDIGEAKYLERPVMAHAQDVRDCVAEEMRAAMQVGGGT